jgi:predicted ATPase/class 3 adenylate cyclase
MQGERRIITMLFCDVTGSTAAAEQLDPEEWTEIINGAFEHMIRPIYKYEGIVPRLMGDAILAFFGAPIAHEDDPQRAVLAGLEIQENIKPYEEEIRKRFGVSFALRVGINTGLVVVGEVGSDLRMEYTAIGDAINLAARMEQTAAPGSVQISEETYKLVAPFFAFEELGGIEVKGKVQPVNSYRVLSVKETPSQLRGLEGFSSLLVGREAEMSVLEEQLAALKDGTGGILTVLGEAGLGKSSLVSAAQRDPKSTTVSWLQAHALSYTKSVSYFSWRQIIRSAIKAHESDSPAEMRARLHKACKRLDLSAEEIPFLEAILAVESSESAKTIAGYQGEALLQQITAATHAFICNLAHEEPLVVLFDDLHWIDEASLTLLSNLVDLILTNPVLFICVMRPEKDTPAWRFNGRAQQELSTCFRQIELSPFSRETTNAMLVNLLGRRELPRALYDQINEKAEGNPFFVEEIIRSLIETEQIVRDNGDWRVTHTQTRISLPKTLSGVLSARIDHLPEEAKQTLHFASVIGRLFDIKTLSAMETRTNGLEVQIQTLENAGLIQAETNGENPEYSFHHALMHEAAYNSILLKRRRELHTRVGEYMEAAFSDRLNEFAPLLAHHFYAARDERSLKYDIIAGEKSARLYANAEAITHFNRALEVAKRVKVESDQLAEIYIQLGQSQELSGQYDRALETYQDMQAASIERGDRFMELKCLMGLATIYSTLTPIHDSQLGEKILKQALDLADELGDIPAQAKLHWNLMLNYLFSDRVAEALEHCEPTIHLARQVNDSDHLAFTLNDAGRVYQGVGAYNKAFEAFDEANKLWTQQGNQVMLADNLGAAAMANYFAGNYDNALSLADQAWEISKEIDNYWGQSYSRVMPVYIYVDRGRPDLVVRYATECIEAGEKGGLIASIVLVPVELAWVYGLYGKVSRGIEMAEQALEIAREKMPDWESPALAVMIRLNILKGKLETAEKIGDTEQLNPVLSVVRSHYLALIGLTDVEMELARKNFQTALSLSDDLLDEISPLGWINNPEIMNRKAEALIGLGRLDDALQTLTEACSLAEKLDAKHHLWPILSNLEYVSAKLGNHGEAEHYHKQACEIIEFIAEKLEPIGLKESFLDQPRIQKLIH